jgi:hypothetical protein
VERHEHFEALSAAASIGQASGSELAELQEHLGGCPACREAYSDFLQLGAVRCAAHAGEQEVTGPEAMGYIDSGLFREKFLKKAAEEGIVFHRDKVHAAMPEPMTRRARYSWRTTFAFGLAASVLFALAGMGGYWLRARGSSQLAQSSSPAIALLPPTQPAPEQSREAVLTRLEGENRRLTAEIASLKSSLANQSSASTQLEAAIATSEKERAALQSAVEDREAKIEDLGKQLSQTQTEVASVRADLEKARTGADTTLVAAQLRVRELSDQLTEQSAALDREREMLAANRDIRDLMSARNLHIADVFDTDTKGKTRSAFGRVFFTEGKSLLIYAYDLNDHRVQDAGYHYRVWGKKEGPGQSARSLGIFYSDDKAQKRWVFKYDDPKVLSEIDSVFVTLEPPGKSPSEPKGEKFLYAYLRNQANHP